MSLHICFCRLNSGSSHLILIMQRLKPSTWCKNLMKMVMVNCQKKRSLVNMICLSVLKQLISVKPSHGMMNFKSLESVSLFTANHLHFLSFFLLTIEEKSDHEYRLILRQLCHMLVLLSIFAFPLIHFSSQKEKLFIDFHVPKWTLSAWACAST